MRKEAGLSYALARIVKLLKVGSLLESVFMIGIAQNLLVQLHHPWVQTRPRAVILFVCPLVNHREGPVGSRKPRQDLAPLLVEGLRVPGEALLGALLVVGSVLDSFRIDHRLIFPSFSLELPPCCGKHLWRILDSDLLNRLFL